MFLYFSASEIMTPFSLNFSPDGEKLFCGFKNRVDIFNVIYPNVKPTTYNIKGKNCTYSLKLIDVIFPVNFRLP